MPKISASSSKLRTKTNLARTPVKSLEDRLLWKLVNSAFFLWLVSSIGISFGTWKYTQWSVAQQKRSELAERVQQLDQEIEYRLGVGGMRASQLRAVAEAGQSKPISNSQVEALLTDFLAPPTESRTLYEQYSKRGTLSLMKELSLLLEAPQRTCVEFALNIAQSLRLKASSFKTYGDLVQPLSLIADYRWSIWAQTSEAMRDAVNVVKPQAQAPADSEQLDLHCGAAQ